MSITNHSPTDRSPPWLDWAAWFILAAAGAEFMRRAWPILADPYVLNFSEGINLWAANQALAGDTIYSDLSAAPFNYYAYPPLYAWLSAIGVAIFGNGLFAPRLLTVLSEVAVLACVWRLVRRSGVPRWLATVTTALAALLLASHRFHALARVDFTQIALVLFAVDSVLAFLSVGGRWRLIAAGSTGAAAWLTKPTALVTLCALGVACLFLGLRGERKTRAREAAVALLSTAAACGLIALGLNAATDGQFWLHTVTLQSQSGFYWSFQPARIFFATYQVPLIAGGLALLFARGRGTLRFLTLTSLAWWFTASQKEGADQNYNLEPLCLLVVTMGVCATRWLARPGTRRPGIALVLAVVGVAGIAIGPLVRKSDWAPGLSGPGLEERAAFHRLVGKFRDPAFTEEPFFNTAHGRPVIGSDIFQLTRLANTDYFDPAPFLDLFRDGHFRYVVCSYRFALGIPGAVEALDTHYDRAAATKFPIMGFPWFVFQHRNWRKRASAAPAR